MSPRATTIAFLLGTVGCPPSQPSEPPEPPSAGVVEFDFEVEIPDVDAGQAPRDLGILFSCPRMEGVWRVEYRQISGNCGKRKFEVFSFVDGQPRLGGACKALLFTEAPDRCEVRFVSVCGKAEWSDRIKVSSRSHAIGESELWNLGEKNCDSWYGTKWTRQPIGVDGSIPTAFHRRFSRR